MPDECESSQRLSDRRHSGSRGAVSYTHLSEDYTKNELTNPPEDVVGRSCTLMDIGDEASKIVDLWTRLKG